jgi:hypothetical protein
VWPRFNNLLQAINGYTQLLSWTACGTVTMPAPEIHKSGKGRPNWFSTLLFGRMVSRKAPVDINQEVEQARRILERTIPNDPD